MTLVDFIARKYRIYTSQNMDYLKALGYTEDDIARWGGSYASEFEDFKYYYVDPDLRASDRELTAYHELAHILWGDIDRKKTEKFGNPDKEAYRRSQYRADCFSSILLALRLYDDWKEYNSLTKKNPLPPAKAE